MEHSLSHDRQTAPRGRWRVWAVLALLLALMVGGPALSDAEQDQGILERMLQDVLSDAGRNVHIRGFAGALSSRATIEELTIADDQGVWITLTGVVIDWNRAALFDRRVEVNELSAETIDLARIPSTQSSSTLPRTTASEGFSLPELPVSVHIGTLSAELVRLDASIIGQPVAVTLHGAMSLEGGQGEANFEARRIDQQEGSFVFSGDFDNNTRFLSFNLALNEGRDGIAATVLNIPDHPALGLSVAGEGPISTFAADIAMSTNDVPRVTGRFSLVDATPETGVLHGGGFSLDVDGDLRPFLNAELHPFFGARSTLRATGQRSESGEIDFPELTISTGSMNLSGQAVFAADGLPKMVRLTAGIENPSGEPVLLPGTSGGGRISSATLSINHDASVSRDWRIRADIVELSLPNLATGNATLDASGRLNAASDPEQDIEGTPQPMFEGVFEFLAQNIRADDPALQRAIGSEVFGLASLEWPGPGEVVDLTGLALEGNTLSLTAYGGLAGLTFDGFAEFSAPDLAAFSGLAGRQLGGRALATWQGQANPLTGALDMTADLTTTDLTMDQPEADAFLAGESHISVSLRRDTEGTTLRNLAVTAGEVNATMQGQLRPGVVDLTARLTTGDLSQMGAGYGGRVALDVSLATEAEGQRLRLDGTVVDLQLADLPAAEFLGGLLNGANRMRGNLLLRGEWTDVALFTFEGPRIAMTANGTWSPTTPDLTLALERLDLAALGATGSGIVAGNVHFSGTGDGQRQVTLAMGGTGRLRSGVAELDGLLSDGAHLDAQVTIAADGTLRIDTAQLATTGLNVTARGQQDAQGNTQMTAQGQLDNLGRLIPGLQGAVQVTAEVGQRADQPGYDVSAQLTGPSELSVTARGRVEGDNSLALVLAGQLQSAIVNTIIEPSNVAGLIQFNGSLEGPPSIDSLRLDAQINDAHYVLPTVGVAFAHLTGTAQVSGLTSTVRVSGESLAGGTGALEGTIELTGARQADLTVSVENFIVQLPQLAEARVTGSVTLSGPLDSGAWVRGEVDVNQAEIRIPNSPLARNGVGPQGLRHIGEDAASLRTREAAGIAAGTRHGRAPVPLNLDLTLRAPGHVFVRGRGLDAEMGGSLRLRGTTRDVVPSGSFNLIRGRLDLLGNRFNLTDGSASMVGIFTPYVTLTATTESDGVSTSVTLAGPANEPEITFSSTPELPQDEVLARLIFRRSLASLSPFQAAQLALSVATLTGRADNSILSRTRQAMGLDDLDFTVDEQGNTALRAGRYITDQVYTDVSVDSAGRGEVSINLDLTSNITLRGRTDTEGRSGVGIFFERDY